MIVHTDADDIELKAALQQLLLDLVGDGVEAHMAFWEHRLLRLRRHCAGGHCGVCVAIKNVQSNEVFF